CSPRAAGPSTWSSPTPRCSRSTMRRPSGPRTARASRRCSRSWVASGAEPAKPPGPTRGADRTRRDLRTACVLDVQCGAVGVAQLAGLPEVEVRVLDEDVQAIQRQVVRNRAGDLQQAVERDGGLEDLLRGREVEEPALVLDHLEGVAERDVDLLHAVRR